MDYPSRLFIDTSYVVGLYNQGDEAHKICVEAYEMSKKCKKFYTTDAVLLEIGNAFSSIQNRKDGARIIQEFRNTPKIQIINLTDKYFEEAFKLYKKVTDKEWDLIDCFAIVVMKKYKIRKVLTVDHHFNQADFEILPFRQ